MNKPITIKPRISEKGYSLKDSKVYVVEIEHGANKQTVKREIERKFGVKVKSVNKVNIKGKKRRTVIKKGRSSVTGKDSSLHKAYVTLHEGSLPFYEAIEEEEKHEQKVQAEIDKRQETESKPKKHIHRAKKVSEAEK